MGAEAPVRAQPAGSASVPARTGATWALPLAAGAAMLMPVNLWDVAIERELAQVAIRRACREHGVQPRDGEVARCNDRILRALVRGHRASWLINAAFVASYLGGPLALNAGMAAWLSHLTRRIVQRHLQRHGGIETLTEDLARAHLLDLLPWPGPRPSDGAR